MEGFRIFVGEQTPPLGCPWEKIHCRRAVCGAGWDMDPWGSTGSRAWAGREHGEGWCLPRSGEIQHCWPPVSSLHSQITAVGQGDTAWFPPLSQQSHRRAVRRFSHLHLPLARVPACLSSSPLLRDQPALVLVTGIWAINPFYLGFAGSDVPQIPCRNTRWSLAGAGVGGSAPVCFRDQTSQGISDKLFQLGINQGHI